MSPTRRPTARERIADWTLAYRVVLEEMIGLVNPRRIVAEGSSAPDLWPLVRTAALAAAILVASAGAERTAVAVAEEESGE